MQSKGCGNDSANVTGSAADVIAPACRSLFVNDDPASFKNNGNLVGRDSNNNGAWAGLFRSGSTGVVFENGVAEFQRSNAEKDINISYRLTDATVNKNVSFDSFVARNVGGVLKLIGNQYAFAGRVRPYQEFRELVNSPAFSSYNVGYNIDVDDVLASGVSIFSQVVVTPPAGLIDNATSYTFVPAAGTSYLALQNSANVTALRLNGEFQDKTNTAAVSSKETNLLFVSPLKTDAQIAVMPEQGVWTFTYSFVDTTRTPVTQTVRTTTRPYTVAELRKVPLMDLTANVRTGLVAASSANGAIVFGAVSLTDPNIIDISADGDLAGWTVPTGAAAPTSVSVLGSAPFGSTTAGVAGLAFNDGVTLASSLRKVKVFCAQQTVNDKHCDSTTAATQYAAGTRVNQFIFNSLDQKSLQTSRRFGLYKLQ